MSEKVMGYIRTSGASQIDKDGPIRQREAIIAFAAKHGLELTTDSIFEEKGVSGDVHGLDRPAFSQMLIRIAELREAGIEIAGFVIERMDRLSRELISGELLLGECRKRKLAVYATDQGDLRDMASDGDDCSRVLIRQVLLAMAQWQKNELVKKLRIARERKQAERGYSYGRIPREVECLEMIQLLHENNCKPTHIANALNVSGFCNSVGRPWSREAVFRQMKVKGILK